MKRSRLPNYLLNFARGYVWEKKGDVIYSLRTKLRLSVKCKFKPVLNLFIDVRRILVVGNWIVTHSRTTLLTTARM